MTHRHGTDPNGSGNRPPGGDDTTAFLHLVKAEDAQAATPGCWFGGLPCLRDVPWPRGDIGKDALTFLAQLDLGSIPRGPWSRGLPATGALAFFVSQSDRHALLEAWPYRRFQHKVVHVPAPTPARTQAPDDLPPLGGANWARQLSTAAIAADAPRLLRHWPMRVVAQPEGYSCMDEKRSLIRRDIVWSASPHNVLALERTRAVHPFLLIERYHEMLRSGLPPETRGGLAGLRGALDALGALIGDAGLFDLMPPETYRKASDSMRDIESRIDGLAGSGRLRLPNNRWPRARMTAIYDLIRHSIDRWGELDDETRALYRRWLGGTENCYHQAFGAGPFRGDDEPGEPSGYRLLARFNEDPGLGWDTGGDEDYRFYISAGDLRARRWDRAFTG